VVGGLTGGLLLITTVVVTALSGWTVQKNTLAITSDLISEVASRTRDRVQNFLEVPRTALEMGRHQASVGGLNIDEPAEMESWFFDYLAVYPMVGSIYYGDELGRFFMVKRMPDGALHTKQVHREDGEVWATWQRRVAGAGMDVISEEEVDPKDRYDPRARPWYKGASATGGLFWTEAYIFSSDKQPGISAALPLYEGDALKGVLSLDIRMQDFSSFVSGLAIGDNGLAVLLDGEGRVVAGEGSPTIGPDGDTILPAISASPVPELVALSSQSELLDTLKNHVGHTLRYTHADLEWRCVLTPIHIEPGTEWMVAVLVPEDDFLGEIKRATKQSYVITLVFLLISLLLSAILTRWITRSLRSLVEQAERVQRLELDRAMAVSSPFTEIHEVLHAFEGMKTGLRSFQKYMPMALVRKLLSNKQETVLGSTMRPLTIYFSDIAGFTPISEALGVKQMSQRLGFYHSNLTSCIQDNEGLVVQYVGDEIMAFWGAPDPVEDEASKACLAALKNQEIIDHLWDGEPDIPFFDTRMGIHTATVAVGHFGSEERLYYGAVGDGVNLASRLEGTNKVYDTKIIISETVEAQISPDRFTYRHLDRVAVKGKVLPIEIYELMGQAGEVDPARVKAARLYEQALEHYFAQRWAEAISTLEEARTHRGDDQATDLLMERCQAFQESPPGDDWDGVYRLKKK